MINLELLFFASKVTGDTSYKDIAVKHAITTIKNHFRPDYSTYHVVDYDPETGLAVHHESHQGFADNSTWSRGQAWAIYGYTMAYRETGDRQFLEIACKAADYYLKNKRLPADKIPYWDFNANEPGYTPRWKREYDPHELSYIPRDASAGAIVTAALLELSGYTDPSTGKRYFRAAETMLRALSSSEYQSPPGSNGGFVLEHCVGSFPGKSSVDTPLPYGDYYYVQALMRYRDLLKH
jgi:hypothetical protein